jgi:predicted dehydrogenase
MILSEVKWGIIGCGNVTEVKSGPALQKVEHSSLVAVMRRSAFLAEDYSRRHNVSRWYADANMLINDPEVNAVYVATPPDTHAEYAIRAMRAGKAVYVEKPMARNHEECLKMIRVSEETGMPLLVAYYRRALPGFVKVKDLVDSGVIGDVRLVNIRFYRPVEDELSGDVLPWRLQPEISGGGIFFDLASHTLDYLDFVFGPIGKIQANTLNLGGKYKAEDTVLANWIHESGVAGTGTWCFVTSEQNRIDEIEIIGSKGRILFSTFDFVPVILENEEGRSEYPFPKPDHVQQHMIEKVVAFLRGEGVFPSTGISGARTNWVMDRMVEGYYK